MQLGSERPADASTDPASTNTAVLVCSNLPVARRAAYIMQCGGLRTRFAELSELATLDDAPRMICLPQQHWIEAVQCLGPRTTSRLFVWRDADDPSFYAGAALVPQICGAFSLPHAGLLPRSWELLSMTRRLSADLFPFPQQLLSWGHSWLEIVLESEERKSSVLTAIEQRSKHWLSDLLAPTVSAIAGALFTIAEGGPDPGDNGLLSDTTPSHGARTVPAGTSSAPGTRLGIGIDGERLILATLATAGGVSRKNVFNALAATTPNSALEEAIGFLHRHTNVLFFDVSPDARTQVTAVIELSVSKRDTRRIGSSVHFFEL